MGPYRGAVQLPRSRSSEQPGPSGLHPVHRSHGAVARITRGRRRLRGWSQGPPRRASGTLPHSGLRLLWPQGQGPRRPGRGAGTCGPARAQQHLCHRQKQCNPPRRHHLGPIQRKGELRSRGPTGKGWRPGRLSHSAGRPRRNPANQSSGKERVTSESLKRGFTRDALRMCIRKAGRGKKWALGVFWCIGCARNITERD